MVIRRCLVIKRFFLLRKRSILRSPIEKTVMQFGRIGQRLGSKISCVCLHGVYATLNDAIFSPIMWQSKKHRLTYLRSMNWIYLIKSKISKSICYLIRNIMFRSLSVVSHLNSDILVWIKLLVVKLYLLYIYVSYNVPARIINILY